jgi:hypothetical protein
MFPALGKECRPGSGLEVTVNTDRQPLSRKAVVGKAFGALDPLQRSRLTFQPSPFDSELVILDSRGRGCSSRHALCTLPIWLSMIPGVVLCLLVYTSFCLSTQSNSICWLLGFRDWVASQTRSSGSDPSGRERPRAAMAGANKTGCESAVAGCGFRAQSSNILGSATCHNHQRRR